MKLTTPSKRQTRRDCPEGEQKPRGGTYPRPLFLIAQLHDEMVRRLDRHMQPMEMSWALGRVFNAISTRPHISSAQLAKMFGITPQSVKQSLMVLEKRGLIERIPSTSDQRVLETVLTDNGKALRREHGNALDLMYKEVFEKINDSDVDEFVRIMINMLNNIRPESLNYFTDLDKREPLGRPTKSDPPPR